MLNFIAARHILDMARFRLRVVSNFGDSGEIHGHAQNGLVRGDTPWGSPFSLARASVSSESPKLETTRSLGQVLRNFQAENVF